MKDSKKKQTHLVYIINDAGFFVTHRLAHAKYAIKQGWRVSVICADSKPTKIIKQAGINQLSWNLNQSSLNLITEIKSNYQLFKLMKSLEADIFHSVTIKANLYSGLVAKFGFSQPIIFAISGFSSLYYQAGFRGSVVRFFLHLFYKIIFTKANCKIITQNKEADKKLSKLSKNKCTLIKGVGIDIQRLNQIATQRKKSKIIRFGFISRLIKEKGVIEYLLAANQIIKKYPNTSFEIWGNFYQKSSVLSLDEITPYLNKKIIYKGYSKDTAESLRQMDVFVLPSYHEGFSRILLEAAAAGCALIATNTAGCLEIVADKKSGLIVSVKSTEQLVAAMSQLINNSDLLKSLAHRAKESVSQELSISSVSKKIFKLQSNLV